MNYKVIDKEKYYRKGVFRHFTEDCRCSTSITARIDVTELATHSKNTGTKFYINFLYILSKVLNSREDYRMGYLWQTDELICYDVINPTQYVFHEDTETCTPVYTEYDEDYEKFYAAALKDVEEAKKTREYGLDMISPEGFISQHRKKSYEELLALRDDLFADIQRFEHKEISEDEWMIVKERIEADLFRRGTLWHDRAFLT